MFAAPAGGSVANASVTTDANGRASTTMTLGKLAGPQGFLATTGDLSVAIPATAVAGAPAAIVALSGSGQSDTVRAVVAPLVARVTDQFGNPTPGVVVSWQTSAPLAALGASTSTTDADGRATIKYTLGTIPGVETVSASVAGVANPALFKLQTLVGPPTRVTIVSGDKQNAVVGTSSTVSLVVKVTDATGTPVSGTTVVWTAINGTVAAATATDASGLASNTVTIGTRTGQVLVTASLPNGASAVSFALAALAGKPAALTFISQPAFKLLGALAPVSVMIVDSFGNQTASTETVTISIAPGLSTVLGGTLARAAVNGIATFDDLTLDLLGNSVVLRAQCCSLPQAVSGPVSTATSPNGLDVELFDEAMQPIASTSADTARRA
jgi:hypothetical protein